MEANNKKMKMKIEIEVESEIEKEIRSEWERVSERESVNDFYVCNNLRYYIDLKK